MIINIVMVKQMGQRAAGQDFCACAVSAAEAFCLIVKKMFIVYDGEIEDSSPWSDYTEFDPGVLGLQSAMPYLHHLTLGNEQSASRRKTSILSPFYSVPQGLKALYVESTAVCPTKGQVPFCYTSKPLHNQYFAI